MVNLMFWRANAGKRTTLFVQICLQNRNNLRPYQETQGDVTFYYTSKVSFSHQILPTFYPKIVLQLLKRLLSVINKTKETLKLSHIFKILSMFLRHDLKNQSTAFQRVTNIANKMLISEILLIKLFIQQIYLMLCCFACWTCFLCIRDDL